MATITFNSSVRRQKRSEASPKPERKVVSIDEYRGVVLLPVRHPSNLMASSSWNNGPLSAA